MQDKISYLIKYVRWISVFISKLNSMNFK